MKTFEYLAKAKAACESLNKAYRKASSINAPSGSEKAEADSLKAECVKAGVVLQIVQKAASAGLSDGELKRIVKLFGYGKNIVALAEAKASVKNLEERLDLSESQCADALAKVEELEAEIEESKMAKKKKKQ